MSLNFDVSKIKDYANVTTMVDDQGQKHWHPVTNALIWASIPCGYYHITEVNLDRTIWPRIKQYQELIGGMLTTMDTTSTSSEPLYLTREDVEMHVGLRTNASPKTTTEFNKWVISYLTRMADRRRPKLSAMRTLGWQGHEKETA